MRCYILAFSISIVFSASLAGCGADASRSLVQPQVSALRAARNHFEAIYSFRGGSQDGAYPNGGLTAANGFLYGTTAGGGPTGAGTVYKISPTSQEEPEHIFGGSPDGDDPWPPPIALDGYFYGTTAGGGTKNLGAVFVMTPNGTERTFYSFTGGTDGTEPIAGLAQYKDALYGATLYGGADNDGVLFRLSQVGKEHILHTFGNGSGDGANPYTTVSPHNQVLYGTAVNGGAYGGGEVYTIQPSGDAYTIIYSFGGKTGDGVSPRGAPIFIDGTLFGTTEFGGAYGQGTIYEITPSGAERVIHSFGSPDAEDPTDGLFYWHGVVYGTGYQGGADGKGAVFKMNLRSGKESVIHSFAYGSDGAHPWGTLVELGGNLYGTASLGGSSGIGTVFRIIPNR